MQASEPDLLSDERKLMCSDRTQLTSTLSNCKGIAMFKRNQALKPESQSFKKMFYFIT